MGSAVVIARFSALRAIAVVGGVPAVFGITLWGAARLHGGLQAALLEGRSGLLLAGCIVAAVCVLPDFLGILASLLFRRRAAVAVTGGKLVYINRWVFSVPLNEVRTIRDRPSASSPWVGGREVEIELVSGRRRILHTALLEGDPTRVASEISSRVREML